MPQGSEHFILWDTSRRPQTWPQTRVQRGSWHFQQASSQTPHESSGSISLRRSEKGRQVKWNWAKKKKWALVIFLTGECPQPAAEFGAAGDSLCAASDSLSSSRFSPQRSGHCSECQTWATTGYIHASLTHVCLRTCSKKKGCEYIIFFARCQFHAAVTQPQPFISVPVTAETLLLLVPINDWFYVQLAVGGHC